MASIRKREGVHLVVSLIVAFVFIIILLLQLFHYETLASSLSVLLPASYGRIASLIAAGIVILELAAISYFLPVALSPLARLMAAVSATLVLIGWLALIIPTLVTNQTAPAAVIGSIADLQLNWAYALFIIVLLMFSAFVIVHDMKQLKS